VLVDRAFETDAVVPTFRSAYVCLAVGKAARGMAEAAARRLGSRIRDGLIITTERVDGPFPVVVGSHPVPTDASENAGRLALELARATTIDETLIVLLSGGASALMAVPADGVTLGDKARATELLLRNGASIGALNCVRKHLSAIKGGRLAQATAAPTLTFAISDVVGDDLSVIGSGPTVGDLSTFADALAAIDAHGGRKRFPRSVVARLAAGARGELPETPKTPGAIGGAARVIGSRRDAMAGAAGEARARGYSVRVADEAVVGEARIAARACLTAAAAAADGNPLCLISSGETTVRVTGQGRGGRNQEFALAAVDLMSRLAVTAALASVGTDGVDGPTDAAGAVVDSSTATRASEAGLSAARFLDNNDAYAFFDALRDLIHTGPTGTNVGDLQVILLA
jgi:hydroxypyruvate reductase